MAGRIRLHGNALAWKRCSPGNDATVHGPVSIGSADSIPCSKVARAQLVTHGVRALPSGVRAFGWDCRGHLIVPPGPSSAGLVTGLGQKCLHMYSPYKDQTIHRSRAVCIAIPTKGVNIVPLMTVSLGLTGGLALDTKARRPAWRFFARVEAVVSCSSGLHAGAIERVTRQRTLGHTAGSAGLPGE